MESKNSEYNADNQQERLINKMFHKSSTSLLDKKEEIIKLYNEKLSLRAVAKKIGCSYSGVKRILKKFNVPMRNKCCSLNLCPESFTNEEFQIILGTILGDGHLVKQKKTGESQLYLGHSIKQQKYIEWKYDKLKRFVGCNIYPLKHKLKYKKEVKEHTTLNFVTRKSNLFTKFRNVFYDENGKKIFPKEFVENNLSPLSLAVWYMDDGYTRYGFQISTQSFSYEENKEILNILQKKFNLFGKIKEAKNNKFFIVFNASEKKKLKEIIRKYVVDCMKYKID